MSWQSDTVDRLFIKRAKMGYSLDWSLLVVVNFGKSCAAGEADDADWIVLDKSLRLRV